MSFQTGTDITKTPLLGRIKPEAAKRPPPSSSSRLISLEASAVAKFAAAGIGRARGVQGTQVPPGRSEAKNRSPPPVNGGQARGMLRRGCR